MLTQKKKKGVLTIISGFSGAGKGTLVKALLKKYPDVYSLSISATTREPRAGEQDGKEYFFKTKEQFTQMNSNRELIEYACYVDNYYGTPKEFVKSKLDSGKDVILEIEVQGALKVKAEYPDTLLLFVATPDVDTLLERLRGRGSETEESIQKRVRTAYREANYIPEYDFLVINDEIDECVENIHQIITRYHCKPHLLKEFIYDFKQQLNEQLKGEI